MSVPEVPPSEPGEPAVLPKRLGGVAATLLVLLGIVLLLPGLCSLGFMVAMPGGGGGAVGLLWLICFLIAIGGVWLIAYAVRNR
jgi:hypothetical protein